MNFCFIVLPLQINQNHIFVLCMQLESKLKINMLGSKSFPEALQSHIVEAYSDWEGYKCLSKRFGIHGSIARQIMYKWKTFGMASAQSKWFFIIIIIFIEQIWLADKSHEKSKIVYKEKNFN